MSGMNSSLKSAYRDCRANASRIVAYETYYRDKQDWRCYSEDFACTCVLFVDDITA